MFTQYTNIVFEHPAALIAHLIYIIIPPSLPPEGCSSQVAYRLTTISSFQRGRAYDMRIHLGGWHFILLVPALLFFVASRLLSCWGQCSQWLLPNCIHCFFLRADHPKRFPDKVPGGQGVPASSLVSGLAQSCTPYCLSAWLPCMGPSMGFEALMTFLLCVWAERAALCRPHGSPHSWPVYCKSFHSVTCQHQMLAGIVVDIV